MDADEYRTHLLLCYRAIHVLAQIPLQELLDNQNRADAIGPFIDPTLWIRNRDKLNEDRAIVEACLAAVNKIPKDALNQMRQHAHT